MLKSRELLLKAEIRTIAFSIAFSFSGMKVIMTSQRARLCAVVLSGFIMSSVSFVSYFIIELSSLLFLYKMKL